jgi:hypothetical protein
MSDYDTKALFGPEDIYPDIVFTAGGTELTADEKEKRKDVKEGGRPVQQLCTACGWTTYHQRSSYLPRLRIVHTRPNSGLWEMGNEYAIWDRPTMPGMDNDYMTWKFLKEKGVKNIPLLDEMHQFGKPSDPHNFTVMSRAKGASLVSVWQTASQEEKRSYADQLITAIRELRQYTAPYPQRVDGSPLWDNLIGQCHVRKACKKIGKNTEDWFINMDAEMRYGLSREYKTNDNAVIDRKLQDLKNNFPIGPPYVLTHADLNTGNIIVNNGKIQAIIDWELGGYYPWWAERWAMSRNCVSDACKDLYHMIWAELDPDRDQEQFGKQVYDPVRQVEKTWKYCPVTHSEQDDAWHRPAFCECKPYGGLIRRAHHDAELKHEIDTSKTARATYNPQ